ncbi:hypothetical protein [Celeribacter marinus]|uniref:Uncharacterized protein n=1 Tax=Celeribacter marinus TaxID=1397108 RepID=A0A0N9ZPE4_9RHOB|nr:hypothetical protein [Celeribacter marinus]ALI55416.1 hypothetical protein IMCC12053_1469 [Celeribacter marinus]SFK18402.1 hypothetical protein SAMN05444421_10220 [Celeribacter marinus]
MLRLIYLLLPALMPSWSFFKTVEASPRVEFRLGQGAQWGLWQDARPRPARIPFAKQLRRMAWNPRWNEALYLVSLSERLIIAPSAHSVDSLNALIAAGVAPQARGSLQFRVAFLDKEGAQIIKTIEYESDPVPLPRLRQMACQNEAHP